MPHQRCCKLLKWFRVSVNNLSIIDLAISWTWIIDKLDGPVIDSEYLPAVGVTRTTSLKPRFHGKLQIDYLASIN